MAGAQKLVACSACGNSVSVHAQTCPACAHPTPSHAGGRWTWLIVLAACLVVLRICYVSFASYSRERAAEQCAQSTAYFERFCSADEMDCHGSARKLAHCE